MSRTATDRDIARTVGERSLSTATLGVWRKDHGDGEYRIGLCTKEQIDSRDAADCLNMNLPALAHPTSDGPADELYWRYCERFEHEDDAQKALDTLRRITQSRTDAILVTPYMAASPHFDPRPVVLYALRTGETPDPDSIGYHELLREVYAEDGRAYDPSAAGYHADGEPGRIVAKLSEGDTPEDARSG